MVALFPVKPRPLTRTAAQALLPLARAGDEAAASRMMAGVSAFVVRIAKKYARRVPGTDVDDLAQAGMIAASQSITTYDPDRGTAAWTSYAMTAAARGIAREAGRAKQLQCRFPTADEQTEVDTESIPDREPAAEFGDVATLREVLAQMDPLERSLIELSHGLTGERLEGAELAARLGLRSRKLFAALEDAQAHLRNLLEDRGLGKALGKG